MNFNYLPIVVLAVGLSGSYYLGFMPPVIFLIYGIASTLTYLIYAKDKQAAKNNGWRVSEVRLHLFSLFFGWPGAVVAQQKLRHKSNKWSFRIVFIVTILMNVGLVVGVHTNDGTKHLRDWIYQLESLVVVNIDNQLIHTAASLLFEFRNSGINATENSRFYIRKSQTSNDKL